MEIKANTLIVQEIIAKPSEIFLADTLVKLCGLHGLGTPTVTTISEDGEIIPTHQAATLSQEEIAANLFSEYDQASVTDEDGLDAEQIAKLNQIKVEVANIAAATVEAMAKLASQFGKTLAVREIEETGAIASMTIDINKSIERTANVKSSHRFTEPLAVAALEVSGYEVPAHFKSALTLLNKTDAERAELYKFINLKRKEEQPVETEAIANAPMTIGYSPISI